MAEPTRTSIGARRNPQTEAAVLDAAAQIIAEDGFHKLTIEGVARRAHAGKATVYRWWPGRGHLLLALYSRAKSTMTEPDTGDLTRDLTLYFRQMLDQLHGSADKAPLAPMLRLLIAEAQLDPAMHDALMRERHERWVHIDNIVRRAEARGELNPAITADRAEQRVISMLWYLLLNGTLPPADDAAALIEDIVTDLRARGREGRALTGSGP